MPQFFRASVFQPLARTRNAEVSRGTATVAGTTPNGNNVVMISSTLRTSAVLRNINHIVVSPLNADIMWFGYEDAPDLTATGFPVEPGASIALEANRTVYAKAPTGDVYWAVDGGEE